MSDESVIKTFDDNPIVYIEAVEQHAGDDIYLVFNAATKAFVCQGQDHNEILSELKRIFVDKKTVSLLVDKDDIRPILFD